MLLFKMVTKGKRRDLKSKQNIKSGKQQDKEWQRIPVYPQTKSARFTMTFGSRPLFIIF
jgi:hypothetical protein